MVHANMPFYHQNLTFIRETKELLAILASYIMPEKNYYHSGPKANFKQRTIYLTLFQFYISVVLTAATRVLKLKHFAALSLPRNFFLLLNKVFRGIKYWCGSIQRTKTQFPSFHIKYLSFQLVSYKEKTLANYMSQDVEKSKCIGSVLYSSNFTKK